MLPACHRLRRRPAFDLLYRNGRRQSGSLLLLYCLPKPSEQAGIRASQVAVVVSKKVSKLAVARNRVKRRLRAAAQLFLPDLSPGYWLLLVARPTAAQSTWADLRAELWRLLDKARLWREG